MEWCLDCHRAPEKYISPRDHVFDMSYQMPTEEKPVQLASVKYTNQLSLGQALKTEYGISGPEHLTTCSVCHR